MQRAPWQAPFNTLTGRMVLVTIAAVIVSYAIALVLLSNERGAALRRLAEHSAVERIVYTTERLRQTPAAQREALAQSLRDFGVPLASTVAVNSMGEMEGPDETPDANNRTVRIRVEPHGKHAS